jgi:precorrin-6A/cobalt-precorrin-6A reductase
MTVAGQPRIRTGVPFGGESTRAGAATPPRRAATYRAPVTRVLLLGGTTEASALAGRLAVRPDITVITSFAGRTAAPVHPPGEVRIGGYGGSAGLARYVRDAGIDVLIDVTHPFAAHMRWNAVEAAEAIGVPRLRIERPAWRSEPDDDWRSVADLDGAASAAAGFDRVFLTTGRQELEPFAGCSGTWFLVRAIEPPDRLPLEQAVVLLARGPFAVDDEVALMRHHRIDAVVTKNSGGAATHAKVVAARRLSLPVVMVERPPSPPGPQVATIDEAVRWLDQVARAG